jgi:hypothetical protein
MCTMNETVSVPHVWWRACLRLLYAIRPNVWWRVCLRPPCVVKSLSPSPICNPSQCVKSLSPAPMFGEECLRHLCECTYLRHLRARICLSPFPICMNASASVFFVRCMGLSPSPICNPSPWVVKNPSPSPMYREESASVTYVNVFVCLRLLYACMRLHPSSLCDVWACLRPQYACVCLSPSSISTSGINEWGRQ